VSDDRYCDRGRAFDITDVSKAVPIRGEWAGTNDYKDYNRPATNPSHTMLAETRTDEFEEKRVAVWAELFDAAKLKDTAGFALSLMPEFLASLKREWSCF
jgi:hypothetical protein